MMRELVKYLKIFDLNIETVKQETIQTIKAKYKKLAKKYHPDVCKEENCEEKFKELSQAYEYIMNNFKMITLGFRGHQSIPRYVKAEPIKVSVKDQYLRNDIDVTFHEIVSGKSTTKSLKIPITRLNPGMLEVGERLLSVGVNQTVKVNVISEVFFEARDPEEGTRITPTNDLIVERKLTVEQINKLNGGYSIDITIYDETFEITKEEIKESTVIYPKKGIIRDIFRKGDLVIVFGIQF